MTRPARALALSSALVLVVSLLGSSGSAATQDGKPAPAAAPAASTTPAPAAEPFLIEYYYKARWGHAAEFIRLFKKNYLPLLREMERQGRILSIAAHAPRHHATEEGRWDYRITVAWRDALAAHDDHHPEALIRQLFPDFEQHQQEEQRRFEILIAHWDVLVEEQELGDASRKADGK
jgi:hypothetical protein